MVRATRSAGPRGHAFHGTTRASGTPTIAAVDVARVHTSETCTNALLEDGRVMGWDVNSAMFFAGSYHALEAVRRMPSAPPEIPRRAASATTQCTVHDETFWCAGARPGDGGVWCWGDNDQGSIGDGRTFDFSAFRTVVEEAPRG